MDSGVEHCGAYEARDSVQDPVGVLTEDTGLHGRDHLGVGVRLTEPAVVGLRAMLVLVVGLAGALRKTMLQT